MSTPDSTPARSARPPQGTRAELEATQRWWLTWIYGPVMGLIAVGALVGAVAGSGDRTVSFVLLGLVLGALLGAAARLRSQHAATGRLALDERDETSSMRTMGYGYCFAFFGTLAWAVAWAADDPRGVPVPLLALAGLALSGGLGRLCTRREGY